MVAREAEVRGTSSHALLEFLKEGPPRGPGKGDHRARRAPRAVPISPDQYAMGFDFGLGSPAAESVDSRPTVVRKHSKPNHDFDIPISPVTEDDAENHYSEAKKSYPSTIEPGTAMVLGIPQIRTEHDFTQENNPSNGASHRSGDDMARATEAQEAAQSIEEMEQPLEATNEPLVLDAQLIDERASEPQMPVLLSKDESAAPAIQETVLELKAPTYQFQRYGHKVLPPTPGPPPTQLLPLPPPPGTSSPTIAYPDTPTTMHGDVPPSPMPPGFTDISNWPAPPETVATRSPTPPLYPETPIIPVYPPLETPTVPVPQVSVTTPPPEVPQRPRTADPNLQSEVLKLMPPPKRARSASRSRPRALRWVSISTMIDPPQPSPGVDFGTCLSQPLDLTQPASPPQTIHT